MTQSLVQYTDISGEACIAFIDDDDTARQVMGYNSTYDLACAAIRDHAALRDFIMQTGLGESVDLQTAEKDGRLALPIEHKDPAHVYLTGTGLTHLGSAEGRDKMHQSTLNAESQTDSMKMFLMGVEHGKADTDDIHAQPEWFYKGNGDAMVASRQPLPYPHFAKDAGEEPEIAGIYIIDDAGNPVRLGFALANEFSDHVVEKHNYLWLAHSKLRHAALGPEIMLGDLPTNMQGKSKIIRDGIAIWEKDFLTGEDNMSHSVKNLEDHHFKYDQFCRPGDIHIHFFGTATLSFAEGFKSQDGDVFEISAPPFRFPVSNAMKRSSPRKVRVRLL
ncbi:AraD1 family protein [Litorimonas sp. RW-G-Af-16]|uniref:AraD1 family protein n=1 Tax=Litorimonas sp. RW-G-Af-16 TaxID=3241168 RepID=UPI00390C6B70